MVFKPHFYRQRLVFFFIPGTTLAELLWTAACIQCKLNCVSSVVVQWVFFYLFVWISSCFCCRPVAEDCPFHLLFSFVLSHCHRCEAIWDWTRSSAAQINLTYFLIRTSEALHGDKSAKVQSLCLDKEWIGKNVVFSWISSRCENEPSSVLDHCFYLFRQMQKKTKKKNSVTTAGAISKIRNGF